MKIGSYQEDWEVIFPKQTIQLRENTFIKRILNWRTKYRLSDFHKYAHEMQASEQGVVWPTMFNSDAMPKVDGVPKKLELIGGWKIPEQSLKKMVGDGYVLLGEGRVLVHENRSRIWQSIELKPCVAGFSIDLKKLFTRK